MQKYPQQKRGEGEWEGKYNYVVSSKLTFQVGFLFSIFRPPAPQGFKEIHIVAE
jgi:hypothetical protein